MKFSTKAMEQMAEIMAEEMGNQIPKAEDIREVETGMRELLQKVGAEGLQRYLEQSNRRRKKSIVNARGSGVIYFDEQR